MPSIKVADLFARLGFKVDKDSMSGADKAIGGIKSKLKGLAVLAGTALLGGAVKDTLDFEEGLTRLDIASNGAIGTFDEVSKRILDISERTGVAKEEILKAAHSFIALTGDADAANKSMELFAKINLATGASMEDITASAAAMQQNLGILPGQFEKGFNILIAGGKAGKIELRDMASRLAELSPLASDFAGGAGVEGLAKLGAAFQLSAQGFGTAKQASTGLKALFTALKRNAPQLAKKGIKVLDKDENLREFDAIVREINAKNLNATELTGLLGSVEAGQTFAQLVKNKGAWEALSAKTLEANNLAEDYAKINNSASIKVKKAWNTIKVYVSRAILFLGKHWEVTRVALITIAAGFVAVGLASVASAVATAAAWIVALAPFVLLTAIIAAVGLALYGLYDLFANGGSFLKDVFTDAIDFWRDVFGGFFKWFSDKFDAVMSAAKLAVDFASDPTGSKFDKVGGPTKGSIVGRRLQNQFRDIRAGASSTSKAVSAPANITVNVGDGSRGAEIGSAVKKAWGEFWDAKVRDTAAGVGG